MTTCMNKQTEEVMFSSKTDMWETPIDLFQKLDSAYHFTIDVCATNENKKCDEFFSKEQDGLAQEWTGNVWCNPPYGREIGKWVKKASESKCFVCMLLPARTDTKWFHEYIYNNQRASVEFIKGRLKFGGSHNSAPFPSMVVTFNNCAQNE